MRSVVKTVVHDCGARLWFKTPDFNIMQKNASNDGDPGRVGCCVRWSLERYCLRAHS
jgi:hypothetical protein